MVQEEKMVLAKETTDLEELKNGAPYTWGKLIKIHEIGDYAIVEALWYDRTNKVSEVKYHSYVNKKCTGHAFSSLDEALIYAISYKYDGLNTKADLYFCRSVGIVHN
jgi:hypothetical protein